MERFRVPQRGTALLTFKGTEWEGAEVRVKTNAPLGVILDLEDGGLSEDLSSSDVFRMISNEIVVDWNLEDEQGEAIPATFEGLRQVDPAFIRLFMRGYSKHVAEVPDPLDEPSPNGKLSPADLTLQLASSSASLGDSSEQK